ncbi:MAG: hypothetical protein V7761_05240 [Amylibacter sp.]
MGHAVLASIPANADEHKQLVTIVTSSSVNPAEMAGRLLADDARLMSF